MPDQDNSPLQRFREKFGECICKRELSREKIWVHLGWCPQSTDYSEPFRFSDLDKPSKMGLIICAAVGLYLMGFITYVITQII